jgi:hypothetical protein
MRHSHYALTNDLTIWDDLKRSDLYHTEEQSHEFIEFFMRGLIHLHLFFRFVCLICLKIIGRFGLTVVPILSYFHVFPSTNIPHTTM